MACPCSVLLALLGMHSFVCNGIIILLAYRKPPAQKTEPGAFPFSCLYNIMDKIGLQETNKGQMQDICARVKPSNNHPHYESEGLSAIE